MASASGAGWKATGQLLRRVGLAMERMGRSMQDGLGPVERLNASTRVVPLKGKEFQHGYENFVASSASIIGDVTFGERSSAWYGTTVEATGKPVTFGRNSAALDNAVVRATRTHAAKIGDDVTIGPNAVVQGATLEDGAMVGSNAVVKPGATVGRDSYVDANAVVEEGEVVPSGQVWTGVPAKYLRDLTTDEIAFLRSSAGITGDASMEHFDTSTLSADEAERASELYWLRVRREAAVEGTNAHVNEFDVHYDEEKMADDDVIQYYKLTQRHIGSGLFRDVDYNDAEVIEQRVQEQIAADDQEVRVLTQRVRGRRVAETIRRLTAVPPRLTERRDEVLDDLASTDPAAARYLGDFMRRLEEADEEGAQKLLAEFIQMDPRDAMAPDAPAHLAALKQHATKLIA